MDTLIKTRTDLRYIHGRSYAISWLILLVSICIAATIALVLTLHHQSTPVQPVISESYGPSQVTHQQVAARYRDPSLTYFFGE